MQLHKQNMVFRKSKWAGHPRPDWCKHILDWTERSDWEYISNQMIGVFCPRQLANHCEEIWSEQNIDDN